MRLRWDRPNVKADLCTATLIGHTYSAQRFKIFLAIDESINKFPPGILINFSTSEGFSGNLVLV